MHIYCKLYMSVERTGERRQRKDGREGWMEALRDVHCSRDSKKFSKHSCLTPSGRSALDHMITAQHTREHRTSQLYKAVRRSRKRR